jgi:UPF0716 family protein affecting phage T7 exclusion
MAEAIGMTMEMVLVAIGLVFMVGLCAASAVLGAALVCRWLKWAPLNITINVNNYGEPPSD